MIGAAYARMMARYGAWRNESLAAADGHAAHHRGQVHAMLTAAGARPGPTDLFLLADVD